MKNKMMKLSMIFLASLPFATHAENVEIKRQELKIARFKKMQQLSELAKMIDEKDELLHSIVQNGGSFLSQLAADKNLNEQETKDFIQETASSLDNFGETVDEAIKITKNVKKFFVKELFKGDNRRLTDFEALKFLVIRSALERDFLKTLVEQYEEYQQELIEIDQKLEDLQNKNH